MNEGHREQTAAQLQKGEAIRHSGKEGELAWHTSRSGADRSSVSRRAALHPQLLCAREATAPLTVLSHKQQIEEAQGRVLCGEGVTSMQLSPSQSQGEWGGATS